MTCRVVRIMMVYFPQIVGLRVAAIIPTVLLLFESSRIRAYMACSWLFRRPAMALAWVAGSELWGPELGGSKWDTSYIYHKAQVRLRFVCSSPGPALLQYLSPIAFYPLAQITTDLLTARFLEFLWRMPSHSIHGGEGQK